MKIKGAEKNLKQLFGKFREILEKTDSEQVVPGGGEMVVDAKGAAFDGRLASFMFNCWKQAEERKQRRTAEEDEAIQSSPFECTRADFVKFVKHFMGQNFSADKASDIFMHNLRDHSQLKSILRQISDVLSPQNSKLGMDDTQDMFARTGGRGNADLYG